MGIYDIVIKDADGNDVPMSNYKDKVLIIVNTATGCGFTPQYKQLEELYEKYHDKGLEIIDIPCNQFGQQAPGTNEEITEFCQMKYGTQFPQMMKSDVNGPNESPLFTYLKSKKGFETFGNGPAAMAMKAVAKKNDKNYENTPDIKWNFTKFVVDSNGTVISRFEPTCHMDELKGRVAELI